MNPDPKEITKQTYLCFSPPATPKWIIRAPMTKQDGYYVAL